MVDAGNLMVTGVLRLVAWCMAVMPLSAALAVGRFFGFLYGSVLRYHRRDAIEALTRTFPDKTPREIHGILRRMYRNFGMNGVEVLRMAGGNLSQVREGIEVSGLEHVQAALARGKGALILTAHLGNWDLLSVLTPALGYRLTIITKEIKSEAVNRFWQGLRESVGLKLVPAHNSYRTCLATLRRNELVGFMIDQNMISTEGIFVEFLRWPACTTPGLAYLSAQSGAPVVPVFIRRQEHGRHTVEIMPLVEPPPDRKPDTIRKATQDYSDVVEKQVLQCPDQWIWIHRRWRTEPTAADVEAMYGEKTDGE